MGQCACGFTTDPAGNCNGTHKAVKKVRESMINAVWQRHLDGSIGGTEWTNHHGLDRCDCEELVEWMKKNG
jgi:hypothetical protein